MPLFDQKFLERGFSLTPLTSTFGGKKYRLLVIKDISNYVWIFFSKEKYGLAKTMLGLIKNLKTKQNLQVKDLHDSAGEIVAFKKACKKKVLGVEFEYTAPGKPQQNGHVKQILATLFNWVHAMLNGGKFNTFIPNGLWAKALNIATLPKNNLLTLNRT